jgi:hypothetical protein
MVILEKEGSDKGRRDEGRNYTVFVMMFWINLLIIFKESESESQSQTKPESQPALLSTN